MAKTTKDYLEEYLNKKDFEYDVFKDPVYLALKRSYEDNAEKTAEDLLGKYSQISGGGSVSSRAMSAAARSMSPSATRPAIYFLIRRMSSEFTLPSLFASPGTQEISTDTSTDVSNPQ